MPPTKWRRRSYPYYKVQLRDPIMSVWKDHRREAFGEIADAIAYRANIDKSADTRIVEWDEGGSHALTEAEIAARR